MATTSVESNPVSIAVSGRYAYVSNYSSNSISVVDISNPVIPVQVATTSVEVNPISVSLSGRYAYVVNTNSSSISIVDVSNPVIPIQVATTSVGLIPKSTVVSGRYAYTVGSGLISLVDLQGTETNALYASSLEAGSLSVAKDIIAQGILNIGTSLTVGVGGILSQGSLAVSGTSSSFIAGDLFIGTTTASSTVSTVSNLYVNGTGMSSGGWTNGSSRSIKENFTELDKADVLSKISQLEMTQWNYIGQSASTTHIGPIAEDFYSKFGLGGSDKSVSTIDPAGVALVGIQALNNSLSNIFGSSTILAFAGTSSVDVSSPSVTEVFTTLVEKAFNKIFEMGKSLAGLMVNKLTVGSATQSAGITLYDEDTHEPYCLKMKSGVMISTSGDCASQTIVPVSESTAPVNSPVNSPVVEVLSTTTASTTPDIISTISTTTEPVVDTEVPVVETTPEPVVESVVPPVVENPIVTEPPATVEPPIVSEPAPVE